MNARLAKLSSELESIARELRAAKDEDNGVNLEYRRDFKKYIDDINGAYGAIFKKLKDAEIGIIEDFHGPIRKFQEALEDLQSGLENVDEMTRLARERR